MSKTLSKATRTELDGVLKLLLVNVREYRDNEQKRLNDPTIAFSEMLLTVGKVKALRDVLGIIDKLTELYTVT